MIESPEASAPIFALAAAVTYALAGVIAKRGLVNGASPLLLALLGAGFGSVIFSSALFIQHGLEALTQQTWEVAVIFTLAAVLGSFLGRVLHFVGVDRVGATVSQTGVTTHSMFAVLFAILFLGESVRFVELLGVFVVVFGLLILSITRGGDATGWDRRQLLIPIGAAFLFGAADTLRRYAFIATDATPLEGTAVNSIAALVGFITYTLLARRLDIFRHSRTTYRYVLTAAILTPLALLLLMAGLNAGRVVIVVPIAGTVPLFTIVFAYFLLGDLERVTKGVIAGGFCVVVGIYLLTGV